MLERLLLAQLLVRVRVTVDMDTAVDMDRAVGRGSADLSSSSPTTLPALQTAPVAENFFMIINF